MGHDDESCADFIERIVYLLDNELDEDDVHAVKEHLDRCAPCLEKYDVQKTVKSLVARSCSEAAPDTLRERVLLSIREVHIRYTERG
jgi:mycothiol system anti-sigma-R factor